MVSRMHQFVALCLIVGAAQTSAEFWDDFRVTYSPNGFDGHFNRFPKTINDSGIENWQRYSSECSNSGKFNGFQYIVHGDVTAAILFDVNGVIAGIQSLFEKTAIQGNSSVIYEELSPMYQTYNVNGTEYYGLTAYLVDPEIICTTGRNASDLSVDGTGTGLWYQNGPSVADAALVPNLRTDAINDGWTQNNCFPSMGSHNFYAVEEYDSTNCTVMRPMFGLYNKEGELLGFGFIVPGTIVLPHRFENPPLAAIRAILGDTPDCIAEISETVGLTSMHVYFVDTPWFISC